MRSLIIILVLLQPLTPIIIIQVIRRSHQACHLDRITGFSCNLSDDLFHGPLTGTSIRRIFSERQLERGPRFLRISRAE